MTQETRPGNGNGWATALGFVMGLFVLVVVAMTDLFMLIGFGAGAGSGNCEGAACSDSRNTRALVMFGLCALSLVAGIVGLAIASGRRRAYALLAAVLLQVAGVATLWVQV